MGRIWLCQEKTADIPFFLEDEKINIYSLEEMCYYLYQDMDVIDSVLDERLFCWIERELDCLELAEELRKGVLQGKDSFWCIEKILWRSGYYSKEELGRIQETAEQMRNKNQPERYKLRADKLLQGRKYKTALREYRRILKLEELDDPVLEGRILHNMGTAYAGQMLFEQAAACYEQAFEKTGFGESRLQYLLALSYMERQELEQTNMPKPAWTSQLEQKKLANGWHSYEKEVHHMLEQLGKEYMKSE